MGENDITVIHLPIWVYLLMLAGSCKWCLSQWRQDGSFSVWNALQGITFTHPFLDNFILQTNTCDRSSISLPDMMKDTASHTLQSHFRNGLSVFRTPIQKSLDIIIVPSHDQNILITQFKLSITSHSVVYPIEHFILLRLCKFCVDSN